MPSYVSVVNRQKSNKNSNCHQYIIKQKINNKKRRNKLRQIETPIPRLLGAITNTLETTNVLHVSPG